MAVVWCSRCLKIRPNRLIFPSRTSYWPAHFRHRCSSTSSAMKLLELRQRGLFEAVFPGNRVPELAKLTSEPQSIYCGFDPTANSLHIGNLLSLIALFHAQNAGHFPIALIGGATALIGDPSGKSKDRVPMSTEEVEDNVLGLISGIERIADNYRHCIHKDSSGLPEFKILNNRDWYKNVDVIKFLSTVGRHFRVGEMMSRSSVQSRLQSKEGMSCTEFMYQVFQANDWLHLYKNHNCTLQVGGNDQTGNIASGFDLIHGLTKKYVFGLLVPIITSPSGEKLGKTAGNALWLDPERTSPYELFQYFFNLPDSAVDRFLKLYTFLSMEEIDELSSLHMAEPEKRHGQKKLAQQVTLLVHGEQGLSAAERSTEILFGDAAKALASIEASELQQLFKNAPTTKLTFDSAMTILNLCEKIKCFKTNADAERIIQAGGLYINQQRVSSSQSLVIDVHAVLANNTTLVRVGKKKFYLVQWV